MECFKDAGIKLQPILNDLLFSKTILITLVCGVKSEGFLAKKQKLTNKVILDKHILLIMYTFKRLYHFILESNAKIIFL